STYMIFGNIIAPWTQHIRANRDLVRRAFGAANRIGDLTFAAYSCNNLVSNLLMAGDPLVETQREAEKGLAFSRKARFRPVVDVIATQLGVIRTLRGLTRKFGAFDDDEFNESEFEHHLSAVPGQLAECWYRIRKVQALFMSGAYS